MKTAYYTFLSWMEPLICKVIGHKWGNWFRAPGLGEDKAARCCLRCCRISEAMDIVGVGNDGKLVVTKWPLQLKS